MWALEALGKVGTSGVTPWIALLALAGGAPAFGAGQALETAIVGAAAADNRYAADGMVEAVRTSTIGAEVQGQVTALRVRAGTPVRAGDVLLQIDQRIAEQRATASRAQVAAAEARLAAAQAEFDRNRRLFEKGYLSRAALERAEADFKAAQAQANAQLAEANASRAETGLYTLLAPYPGVVSQMNVELGDMVVPGRTLMTIYDPSALRVTVRVPESKIPSLATGPIRIEIADASKGAAKIESADRTVLPTADPVTHTVEVRVALPAKSAAALVPGLFARVWLPIRGGEAASRPSVPLRSIVRRGELTAVYVVDAQGRARLRQVRLGRVQGDEVEVASGLESGERVALDPLAAARSG